MSTSPASSSPMPRSGSAAITETVDARRGVAQARSRRRETNVAAALATAATAHRPADRAGQPVEVGAGRGQHVEHLRGARGQRVPGAGERDPARRAVDQRRAGLALEHGQLLGHRRRREPDRAGRGRRSSRAGRPRAAAAGGRRRAGWP